ncbi:hypothetical protein GJ496_007219 [Pomphorhynchus laevis]|nr:hypothetical protein GJ496_007219 [Pomphorhynchus laevis]
MQSLVDDHQNEANTSTELDYWIPVCIGVVIVALWLLAGMIASLRICFGRGTCCGKRTSSLEDKSYQLPSSSNGRPPILCSACQRRCYCFQSNPNNHEHSAATMPSHFRLHHNSQSIVKNNEFNDHSMMSHENNHHMSTDPKIERFSFAELARQRTIQAASIHHTMYSEFTFNRNNKLAVRIFPTTPNATTSLNRLQISTAGQFCSLPYNVKKASVSFKLDNNNNEPNFIENKSVSAVNEEFNNANTLNDVEPMLAPLGFNALHFQVNKSKTVYNAKPPPPDIPADCQPLIKHEL